MSAHHEDLNAVLLGNAPSGLFTAKELPSLRSSKAGASFVCEWIRLSFPSQTPAFAEFRESGLIVEVVDAGRMLTQLVGSSE